MAYAFLGWGYEAIGESALSTVSATKAYELRDRASAPEKFFITASYDLHVTGNLEKARHTCESWAHAYPRDGNPHGFLAGFIYPVLGKYDREIEEAKKLIEINPDFALGYNVLALDYEALDRLGDAENTLQRAYERELEVPDFVVDRYQIAFLKGDQTAMKRELARGQREPEGEDLTSDLDGFGLAYFGHLREATEQTQRAVDLARRSDQRERAALFATGIALREAVFGNSATARRTAKAVVELSNGREVEYGAAFALASSGDSSRAQTLANDLEKRFPEDTAVRYSYLPTLHALLALNRRDAAKAIELLQVAAPYELGQPPSSFYGFFGMLYPIYVRGDAYLAAHRGAEAATEFQKILNHRGIVVSDPIGALAHLQLGRAFALSGDKTKAKAAYHDFLTLWKDADPDIPILEQAEAEYTKLQ